MINPTYWQHIDITSSPCVDTPPQWYTRKHVTSVASPGVMIAQDQHCFMLTSGPILTITTHCRYKNYPKPVLFSSKPNTKCQNIQSVNKTNQNRSFSIMAVPIRPNDSQETYRTIILNSNIYGDIFQFGSIWPPSTQDRWLTLTNWQKTTV